MSPATNRRAADLQPGDGLYDDEAGGVLVHVVETTPARNDRSRTVVRWDDGQTADYPHDTVFTLDVLGGSQ